MATFIAFALATFRDMGFLAARLLELEVEVNTRAGLDLLKWERDYGTVGLLQWMRRASIVKEKLALRKPN